jgi:hypothetical protein
MKQPQGALSVRDTSCAGLALIGGFGAMGFRRWERRFVALTCEECPHRLVRAQRDAVAVSQGGVFRFVVGIFGIFRGGRLLCVCNDEKNAT